MIVNNKLIKIISCVNVTDEITMSEINMEYDTNTLNHNVCVFFVHCDQWSMWDILLSYYMTEKLILCMLWSFFVFSGFRWEVVVRFVDIGGIVDHLCLNFIFSLYGIKWVHYFWKRHFPLQIISAIRARLSANTA